MKKLIFKLVLGGAPILIGALYYFTYSEAEILIESLESKTKENGPVFNRIKWFSLSDKDVWMMNQSHHGLTKDVDHWDRLAIVIDKTRAPKTARFIQLEPGPLEWSEELKTKPFRVSCFMCHTNGPRAIRPNADSLAFTDHMRIAAWNLRIKTYGRVEYDPSHDLDNANKAVPFRMRGKLENDSLPVKTCLKCHDDSGFISRGFLHRQNILTIQFMVANQFMPPLGFPLSESEKKELNDFVAGF